MHEPLLRFAAVRCRIFSLFGHPCRGSGGTYVGQPKGTSMMRDTSSGGNGHGKSDGGRVVRISTALGTFVVIIVNDLGPAADALTREVEQDALSRLHAHRSLAAEMNTV